MKLTSHQQAGELYRSNALVNHRKLLRRIRHRSRYAAPTTTTTTLGSPMAAIMT